MRVSKPKNFRLSREEAKAELLKKKEERREFELFAKWRCATKHCQKCTKEKICLSHTVVPFGVHKGKYFDSIPLEYLDWLVGQDWIYGELEKRLVRYLKHPVIRREIELLFPDREIEAYPERNRNDPWHGYTMPKEDRELHDWYPERIRPGKAWEVIADFVFYMETHNEPNDLIELPFEWERISSALNAVKKSTRDRVRETYISWRKKLRDAKFINDSLKRRSELLSEALEEMKVFS